MTKSLCHVRPVGDGWCVCTEDHPEAVAVAAQPAPGVESNTAGAALADKLAQGSIACGTSGEWVSIRRHLRDEVVMALHASHGQAPAAQEHSWGCRANAFGACSCGQAPAGAAGGLPIAQEPKYTVTGDHIVNRTTGEAVPHDEPVFVFRARDALGVRALQAYLALIGEREPSSEHADAVRGRIADFRRFAASHPKRMKWPDTTAQAAPFSLETQDQIAAVMLQHGTEDQQRAALAYASGAAPAAGGVAGPVKQCSGIPRPGCDYMAECGSVCRKCGKVHSAHLLMFDSPQPRWASYEVAVSDPVFQVARSIMGTENIGQDRQLVAAINHVLAAAPTPAAPAAQVDSGVVEDAAPSVLATAKALAWVELPLHERETHRIRAEATLNAVRAQQKEGL